EDCTQAEANHLVVVGNEDAGHRRPLRAHSSSSSQVNRRVTLRNLQRIRIMENPKTPRGKPGELTPGGRCAGKPCCFSAPRKQSHRGTIGAEFAAVIAAIHQSSVPSPPAAGNSGTRSRSRRDPANML